jgi:ribose 5-phosphate isomerase A
MLGAMDVEGQKRAAAERALDFVRPGMRLGLGTGSTARYFVEVGERVRAGLSVVVVPSSAATEKQAAALGIPLTTLDEPPALELTVGGADEIAPDLSLIKGGGGALLREKIVASASAALVVIADRSKWVSVLGRYPLRWRSCRSGWPRRAAQSRRLRHRPARPVPRCRGGQR